MHVAWLATMYGVGFAVINWGNAGQVLACVAIAFMLMHYRDTYAKERAQGWTREALSPRMKWGIVGAHLLLSLLLQLTVLVTSVIPGLLSAREEAQSAGINAYVMGVYMTVYAESLNGKAKGGDCFANYPDMTAPRSIASCAVDVSNPARPILTVTTRSGEVITRP
ncbi:hypothetical protein C8263_04760 [Deinococcus arcticus]|uniref:Uncharacterized protein n=2 Tax=Deinococcus arcticus TaxID=2136176 RepID=A0A2T3WBI8_9DEIO|nr:hypothetical protein C8263_04760 [Deinococcus arcticus]